jgi:hypothetical protein
VTSPHTVRPPAGDQRDAERLEVGGGTDNHALNLGVRMTW